MPSATASPTHEIDNHTWANCNMSDELTILHINPITRFNNEVIKSWLAKLDEEEAERKANLSSNEYLKFWDLSQTLELRQVSIQNFCLSILLLHIA